VKGASKYMFGRALREIRKSRQLLIPRKHGGRRYIRISAARIAREIGMSPSCWVETELGHRPPLTDLQLDKLRETTLKLTDEEHERLWLASVRTRGYFKLPSGGLTDEHYALGVELSRTWKKLSKGTIESIRRQLLQYD